MQAIEAVSATALDRNSHVRRFIIDLQRASYP